MPAPAGLEDGAERMNKTLDLEIKDMISALTNRLHGLQRHQKAADPDQKEDDPEADRGVRIITLSGNNVGSTMRGDFDEKNGTNANPGQGLPMGENESLSTYVNSNFQAINNSIMMGGSYTTQDPGVHMDISDYLENKASPSSDQQESHEKKKGKKKKKHSEGSKSDQQSDQIHSE